MLAVEKFATPYQHLVIHTDSKCAMKKILFWNEGMKHKNTEEYRIGRVMYQAVDKGCMITIKKVRAHADNIGNNAIDKIAYESMIHDEKSANTKRKKNNASLSRKISASINTMLEQMEKVKA